MRLSGWQWAKVNPGLENRLSWILCLIPLYTPLRSARDLPSTSSPRLSQFNQSQLILRRMAFVFALLLSIPLDSETLSTMMNPGAQSLITLSSVSTPIWKPRTRLTEWTLLITESTPVSTSFNLPDMPWSPWISRLCEGFIPRSTWSRSLLRRIPWLMRRLLNSRREYVHFVLIFFLGR